MEGEIHLDPGRGPWSQIVFDEIKTKEVIARAGWEDCSNTAAALSRLFPDEMEEGRAS